jgi:hypoxanthine phosphoribosyltransferase
LSGAIRSTEIAKRARTMPGDLYVSWSDYHKTIERLATQVYESGWRFNQIVCIARGGLRVGDVMSRIFKLPLAIIFTSSYTGEAGMLRGNLTVSKHMSMTTDGIGERVLLVDDLVDSGVTLDVVKRHIVEAFPAVKEIRTAVLWYKAVSAFKPDYYVRYLEASPWIHQPFEEYDSLRSQQLDARLRRSQTN